MRASVVDANRCRSRLHDWAICPQHSSHSLGSIATGNSQRFIFRIGHRFRSKGTTIVARFPIRIGWRELFGLLRPQGRPVDLVTDALSTSG